MVDIFALAVSHGLLALAALRLLWRDDLDADGGGRRAFAPRKPFGNPRDDGQGGGER